MHWVAVFVLFLVTVGYMFLGAVVFGALETVEEADSPPGPAVDPTLIDKFLANTSCASRDQLEAFARELIVQYKTGVVPYNDSTATTTDDKNPWDLPGAFYFCATIVTTIGYGHISPTTAGGRIFFIFYAFIGIPIMGVFLVGIGSIISEPIKAFKNRSSNKCGKVLKSIAISLFGFLLLIFIPAIVFHYVEKWTFLEGVYFSVVTLTTVGFGDFVPGMDTEHNYRLLYKILLVVWMLFGLAWVAAGIADIADYVKDTVETKSSSLKATIKSSSQPKVSQKYLTEMPPQTRNHLPQPKRKYIEP